MKKKLNILSTLSFIGLYIGLSAEWLAEKIVFDKWLIFYFGATLIIINAIVIIRQAIINRRNKK